MFKIIIAEFKHETNTFSNRTTDFDCFKNFMYVLGNNVITYNKIIDSEIRGFVEVLADEPDVMLIPVVGASAVPSGKVTMDIYQDVTNRIIDAIHDEGPVDGVLLSLHGAMVTEDSEDGEGDLLEAIRKATGEDTIIVSTLDLHSNITHKMINNANVLINYDYYPHSDIYDRGIEAANIILKTLRGQIKPVMSYSKKPLLLPALTTTGEVMQKYVDLMHKYEKETGVINVSISHGFFCADIYESGMSVVAVTDGNTDLAQRIVNDLSDIIWKDRANLIRKAYKINEAIAKANTITNGPVVLSDGADNPGGGSTSDGTHILRALIEHKVKNAAIAMIYDPESVIKAEKAGVGNMVKLNLGGKLRPEILGTPVECDAYVKLISDGKYQIKGSVGRGQPIDLIKSAVVIVEGIEVIVTSNPAQPFDAEIFRIHGINPGDKKILVVKSTIHFRADYELIASRIIDVDCPGLYPLSPINLQYKKCRRPIYPLDIL